MRDIIAEVTIKQDQGFYVVTLSYDGNEVKRSLPYKLLADAQDEADQWVGIAKRFGRQLANH